MADKGVLANRGQAAERRPAWRRLFDINDRETLCSVRGFHHSSNDRTARLERIGATFVLGYREALFSGPDGPDPAFLHGVPPGLQGFAAEGAAMGCAIRDLGLPFGRILKAWLRRTDGKFSYLTHVGVGWAMARLPFGQARLFESLDPVHRWLAIDGLGFHDTYFRHQRVLAGWQRETDGYGRHAWHQGVGRALWFVAGGEMTRAADLVVSRFDPEWHGDLWAGLGLAITYAGAPDEAELVLAQRLAGPQAEHLAQGAVFAAAAHMAHGHVPAHTERAVKMLSDLGPAEATALADRTRAALPKHPPGPGGIPAYEGWRRAIRHGLPATLPAPEPVA